MHLPRKSSAPVKSIARFEPLPEVPVDECDEYYETMHSPLIRVLFRAMPQAMLYLPARARAQRHGPADWREATSAWRFVTARFDAAVDAGSAWSDAAPIIEEDHRQFMRRLRNCVVDEQVVVDRRSGQVYHESFLVEIDAVDSCVVGRARDAARRYVAAIEASGRSAFGVRLIQLNVVTKEGVAPALDDEGQGFSVGQFHDTTDKAAYVEVHVDHREWAEEFFASTDEALMTLAAEPAVGSAIVYRLDVLGGLDTT